jgi:hypothetical protein
MTPPVSTARYVGATMVFLAALVVFDRGLYSAIIAIQARLERGAELPHMLAAVEHKREYAWLILGTSRTYEAVHPAFIEREFGVKAFKAAGRGKGPRYQYEFYRLYTPLFGAPRVLVLGIDAFMFGIQSDDPFLRKLDGPAQPASRASAAWPPLRLAAEQPAIARAILRILERIQFGFTPDDPQFSVELMQAYVGTEPSRLVEQAEPARYDRAPHARYPGAEGEYFTSLIEACSKEGITVLLVYPPDHIGTYRTHADHDAFIDSVRTLVRGCPTCVVLDYADPGRFPIATGGYFLDGGYGNTNSHLSKAGAEAFSRVWLPDARRAVERFSVPVGRGAPAQIWR